MKKTIVSVALMIAAALLSGCSEGYTGKDGAALKEYLEPAKLKELTEQPRKDIWIIDVRPAEAYRKGHIPTAKSFPSGEIMDRLNEIPKTQNIIMYCETGGRAQMVLRKLEKAGYSRFINWGGGYRYFNRYGSVPAEIKADKKKPEKK